MLSERMQPVHQPRDILMFDYTEAVKEVRIIRTTVEKKPSTILLCRGRDIVLPKFLPIMLEQISPDEK